MQKMWYRLSLLIAFILTANTQTFQGQSLDSTDEKPKRQANLQLILIVIVLAAGLLVCLLLFVICCIRKRRAIMLQFQESHSADMNAKDSAPKELKSKQAGLGNIRHQILVESVESNLGHHRNSLSTHEIQFSSVGSPHHQKSLTRLFDFDSDAPKQCMVCSVRERNAILYNCQHVCSCEHCAKKLLETDPRCPLCREGICGMDTVQLRH